ILTGPSGVGKTFTSKLLSKVTGRPVWKVDKDELWMGSEDIIDHPERYEPGTKAYHRYRKLLKKLVRRALKRKTPSILEGCQFLVAPGTLRGHTIIVLDADESTVVRQRLQRDAEEGKLQKDGYNARREKAETLYRELRPSVDFMKSLPDVETVTPSRVVEWVNSFQRRQKTYRKDAPKTGGWITLDPSGTHVFLENGVITAGPESMTNKPLSKLPKTEDKPKEPESPKEPTSHEEESQQYGQFVEEAYDKLKNMGLEGDAENFKMGMLPKNPKAMAAIQELAKTKSEFVQAMMGVSNKTETATQPEPKQKPPNPTTPEAKKAEQQKFLAAGVSALEAAGLTNDAKRVKESLLPNTKEGRQILKDILAGTDFSQQLQDAVSKVLDKQPYLSDEDADMDKEEEEEPEQEESTDEEMGNEPKVINYEPGMSPPVQSSGETINTQGVQVPKHVERQSKKYLSTLNSYQMKAIRDYTGSSYADLNKKMRSCPPNFECVEDTYHKNLMTQLESALEKAPDFEEPVDVYRGMKLSHESAERVLESVRKAMDSGKEYTMPSITSTTVKPGVAIGTFAQAGSYQKPIVFKIKAKSGVYVESVTSISGENEVIQSSKTRYRPVKIEDTNYEHPSFPTKAITTIYLEEVEWKGKTTAKKRSQTISSPVVTTKRKQSAIGSTNRRKSQKKNDFAGIVPHTGGQPGPANGILLPLSQRMDDDSGEGLGGRLLDVGDVRSNYDNEWGGNYRGLKSVLGTVGNQGVPSESLDKPTQRYLINPFRPLSMNDSVPGLEGLTIERSEAKCPCGLKSKLGKVL